MPPQQQQNSDENAPLWLSVLAIVAILGLWFALHAWIVFFFFKLKYYEIELLKPFTSEFNTLSAYLQTFTLEDAKPLKPVDMYHLGDQVGDLLRYPFGVILFLLSIVLYFSNSAVRYRNTYNMQRLADGEQLDWPQISPVVHLDLIKESIDEGPWAMASTPMQFAKKYRLLLVEKQAADAQTLSNATKLIVKVKRPQAKQIFLMQLGHYWRSPQTLPIHIRALFALFIAKAHGDKDHVTQLNNQIAVSAAKGGPIDFNGVDTLLAKYVHEQAVVDLMKRHAFVYTMMPTMLTFARQDGVYASADFLWLKPIDRRLWYTLNSAGRKTPFTEVAGIFSHHHAEVIYQKPIYVPMVDEAVDAFELAIADVLYKPDEPL